MGGALRRFSTAPAAHLGEMRLEAHFSPSSPRRIALWDEMRPDETVLALARRRHAVVTAGDLAHAGLTRKAIDHRVRVGWLTRVHRGIYLVGPLEVPLSRAMAAVLAVGDGATLSHASAAQIWEMPAPDDVVVDVLVNRDVRNRQGLRVHRVGDLDPRDRTSRQGVPLTTPARTLLDLATTVSPHELGRAVERAELRRLTTYDQLSDLLIRCGSHRGAGPLRRVLDPGRQYTRSQAERRFLDLVAAAGLPTPAANTRVAGYEVDFLWPGERLVVEVDGYAFHSSRAAFERDRARDARLQARGYRVLRFTWRQLEGEPEAVVATVAAALAMGRPIALAGDQR